MVDRSFNVLIACVKIVVHFLDPKKRRKTEHADPFEGFEEFDPDELDWITPALIALGLADD